MVTEPRYTEASETHPPIGKPHHGFLRNFSGVKERAEVRGTHPEFFGKLQGGEKFRDHARRWPDVVIPIGLEVYFWIIAELGGQRERQGLFCHSHRLRSLPRPA